MVEGLATQPGHIDVGGVSVREQRGDVAEEQLPWQCSVEHAHQCRVLKIGCCDTQSVSCRGRAEEEGGGVERLLSLYLYGVKGGTKWRKYMKTCMFLCFCVNFKHESTQTCMFPCNFALVPPITS